MIAFACGMAFGVMLVGAIGFAVSTCRGQRVHASVETHKAYLLEGLDGLKSPRLLHELTPSDQQAALRGGGLVRGFTGIWWDGDRWLHPSGIPVGWSNDDEYRCTALYGELCGAAHPKRSA